MLEHDEYLNFDQSRDYTYELELLNSNSVLSRAFLIFLMMLMLLVGVVVNFVVTIVFLRRFPASAIRSYIVTMSVSDLIATGAGIAMHIETVLSAYSYERTFFCKLYFAVVSFSTNCSSFIIVLMAMDRLRRVQRPTFKNLDTIRSYYHVALVVALSILVTAPFVPMYGIYQDPTPYGAELNVKMCWVDDMYKDTLYPTCYLLVLALTFVGGLGLMCGSYFQIGKHIYRLAWSLREELEYRRANPPPYVPDIYADDPEVDHEGVEIQVTHPSRSQNSALRPHSGSKMGLLLLPETPSNIHSPGKMKKISNVISKIFQPATDRATASTGTEGSSFVSTRMPSTARHSVGMTNPGISHLSPGIIEAGKGLSTPSDPSRHPNQNASKISIFSLFHKVQKPSVNVQDTASDSTVPASPSRNTNQNAVGETTDTATTSTFASPLPRTNRHQRALDNLTYCLATLSAPTSTIARPLSQNRNRSAVMQLGFTTNTTPALDVAQQNRNQSSVAAESGGTTGSAPILPESGATLPPDPGKASGSSGKASGSSGKNALSPDACVQAGAEANQTVTVQAPKPRAARRRKAVRKTDSMETVEQLDVIKRKATYMMITLICLYFFTWFPNLLARIFRAKPANLCDEYADCWMNGPAYFICSVYINSTVNAFVYCFGSVHFRKQVKLFFKPCKERFCGKKEKRRARVQKEPPPQKTNSKKEDDPNEKDKTGGTPVDGEADTPVDGEADKPVNGEADKPVDGEADKPVDGGADKPVDGKQDKPVDGKQDKPVDGEEKKAPVEAQDGNK